MASYKDFMKRFNIPLNEKEIFEKLKAGIINIIQERLKSEWSDNLDLRFCKEAHIEYKPRHPLREELIREFKSFQIYYAFSGENEISNLIFRIECLLKILEGNYLCQVIINDLEKLISELPVNFNIKDNRDGIIFYPIGVKLLDQELVDNVLDWLDSFPTVKKHFKSALEKYQAKKYKRNLLDDLRFSYENLTMKILKNSKSLENQENQLLKFLKNEKVPSEIRSMFWVLTNYFCRYQNQCVKHGEKIDEKEIEFIIYLTATFMRYLLILKDK